LARGLPCERFTAALAAPAIIDQPVLPLARIAFFTHRRIERHVAAEPAVHVDHVLRGDAEPLGDELYLVRAQVARKRAMAKLKEVRALKSTGVEPC
jgi:hypothetical protein